MASPAVAQDKFRAAAADIKQQQRAVGQIGIREDTLEGPGRFLIAGDDFERQRRGVEDGGGEVVGVLCVAGGAGGDDAEVSGTVLAGNGGVTHHRFGGASDGIGLELVRLVKALPKTGLVAFLKDRLSGDTVHLGNEQLHGVGAYINDSAANHAGASLVKHKPVNRGRVKMEVRMPDGCERDLLVPPDWLALVTFKETEELHQTILPEMFDEVVRERIVVVLLVGGIVTRFRDRESSHVFHFLRRRKIHPPEPATAAVRDLEFSAVGQREPAGDGGVLRTQRVQGRAGLMGKLGQQSGRGLGGHEWDEAHGRSVGISEPFVKPVMEV